MLLPVQYIKREAVRNLCQWWQPDKSMTCNAAAVRRGSSSFKSKFGGVSQESQPLWLLTTSASIAICGRFHEDPNYSVSTARLCVLRSQTACATRRILQSSATRRSHSINPSAKVAFFLTTRVSGPARPPAQASPRVPASGQMHIKGLRSRHHGGHIQLCTRNR